jgi:hypothetical protein
MRDASWSPTAIDLEEIASGAFAAETSGALPSPLSANSASFAIALE